MRRLRAWFLRLAGLFNKERRDRELAEELESHLQMHIEDNLRRGMTLEEARRQALIKLGGIEQTKESYRDRRGLPMLETLMQDLRFGVRMLCKNPGFTAVAVLTLALGIGANTAIFSVVKAVLLEPLAYHEPDRLVHIIQNLLATQTIDARPRRVAAMELNEFLELQRRTQTLSHTAAYDTLSEMTLSGREEPIRLVGTPVSASLFPTLGTQPLVGRGFFADEEKPGSQRTLVLSYPAWQKYFASDPNIVNRIITLDGRGYLVAGVMPRGFEFPDRLTEFWLPLNLTPSGRDEIKTVTPLGRLKDGIAIETAAAEANTILGDVHRSYPPDRVIALGKLEVVAVKDELVRPVQPALVVLTVAVGFVLLIACSNVANLLLARGAARQGERAIRAALGASRGRLICQTLTESSLLGIMGGAAGCVLAVGGVRLLRSLGPGSVPRLEGIGIDVTVLAFTFALSMFTGLLFGLIPAFHLSRVSQMEIIKTSAGTKSSERQRTRSLIVIAEMGMAVVLLIGGVLLIRSFLKLSNVNPGFDPSNVLAFQVALPRPLNLNALNESLTQEFLSRLQSLPGVKSVGFANALPLVPRYGFSQPRIQGTPIPVQGVPEFREVSRNYLSAMGLRLLAGRSFGESDGPGQPQVAIVSKAIVPYFGGETPIGKTITLAGNPAEIVGIVDDIREQALNLEPRPQVYIDSRQSLARSRNAQALNWAYFVVRSDRTPTLMIPNVRSILRQMIPGATLKLNVAIMEDIISNSIARPRLYAVLLGVFGAVAVLLAMIGVYGITTYSVAQRTREIGIRIALGAQPWEVLFLALRQSVILATIGILLGLGGAAAVTRYLEAMLFGLTPLDPTTFVAASVAFGFTAVLASYLPARRATKVDPMVALRYE